jgi:ABC-type multidrug transport system ATPase subunit
MPASPAHAPDRCGHFGDHAQPPNTPVIAAEKLGKAYDDRRVLRDINFAIEPGAFIALLGANGAGKSTLLRVIASLIPVTTGDLKLFGESIGNNAARLRARIGMIGHQPILYRDLTVMENLVFFGKLYDEPHPKLRAAQLLEQLRMSHRASDPVGTLSRGMTQRVSIARSLMHDPALLLADEPFAGLDAPSTRDLEQLLTQLHAQERTIVLSNHDIPQSLKLAQRAIVLRGGRVVIDQPTESLDAEDVLREVSQS